MLPPIPRPGDQGAAAAAARVELRVVGAEVRQVRWVPAPGPPGCPGRLAVGRSRCGRTIPPPSWSLRPPGPDDGRAAGDDREVLGGGGLAAALPLSVLLWGTVAVVVLLVR